MTRRARRGAAPGDAAVPPDAAGARRSRALEEPMDISWLQTDPYLVGLVRNPLHGTRYHAFAPDLDHLDEALCTCPDFALRGPARCKHLEAIRLWRAVHPEPLAPVVRSLIDALRLWSAIESGHAGREASVGAMRREGRLLIDGRPSHGAG